jgi:hypothetical protein
MRAITCSSTATDAALLSVFVQDLRKSLAGIEPLPGVHEIELEKLDTDPTNPGSSPNSERYKKREQPIRESWK